MNRRLVFTGMMVLSLALVGCKQRGDTNTSVDSVTPETPNSFLQFLNKQQGNVYSQAWSNAYYHAVDPDEKRRTLEDWKATNDFDTCDDKFHIIFRDSKDLGYGRDMYACKHNDGRFAVYVRNFIVKLFDGDPSNYGPINVEAAIEADLTHHVGTNAIEFSPVDPADSNSEKVAKFFTYTPAGVLNTSLDLDGRGKKPVPQPCMLCHGATLLPWDTDEVLADSKPWDIPEVRQTLRSGKFNQLEINTFDYSTLYPAWSRANQEDRFRRFNNYVLDAYIDMARRDDTNPEYWCADFAVELGMGRYDPGLSPTAPGDCTDAASGYSDVTLSGTYQEDFVPAGWKESASRPAGVELLYKRVIEPHCISCHSLRGNAAGQRAGNASAASSGNAINFNSYENFIGYADIIKDYVFRRGVMPLSLRNYLDFWEDPDDAPAILASYLPGFDLYTSDGKVLEPGRPVAKAGADRTVRSPATLDAGPSLYVGSYQWSVVSSPAGSTPVLSAPTSEKTQFSADMDGDYTIRLSVANVLGTDSQDIVVTIDSALSPAQDELNFYDDIRPILQDAGTTYKREACVNCHDPALGGNALNLRRGIPVFYTDSTASPTQYDRNLYDDIMARVDLDEPENSILLRKPTRQQHGGGVVLDLTNPLHYETYNKILNWIRAGAPCDNAAGDGAKVDICPAP